MNRGNVYSVSSVNQYIKNMFSKEYALSVVFVKGEISNCKYHSSGHIYFSLKDDRSQLTCVMFRGDRGGLDFRMENGQEVVVGGSISVYERDGKYQLYAKKIVPVGDGHLQEQYEKLKKKLEAAGYFDEDRKLPIPKYVKKVGIVTAKTGAAVHDMIQIATRRNPYVQLYLYPAKVQGEGAAQSIAGGISFLDEFGVDVILAGRGGGSMEDLWAFNEEIVAQAIYECRTPVISAVGHETGGSMEDLWAFNEEIVAQAIYECRTPVISAVGHETDVTIADYVADLRAPTPSAAAELAVYDVRLVLEELYGYKDRLARCILAQVDAGREHLDFTEKRLRYLNPENQMVQKRQYLIDMEERLFRNMKNELQKKKQMMSLLAARLDAKSPLKRLAGGYAYVTDEAGRMVDSVKSLQVNDVLMMTFSDGVVKSEVQEVVEEEKA